MRHFEVSRDIISAAVALRDWIAERDRFDKRLTDLSVVRDIVRGVVAARVEAAARFDVPRIGVVAVRVTVAPDAGRDITDLDVADGTRDTTSAVVARDRSVDGVLSDAVGSVRDADWVRPAVGDNDEISDF